MGRTGRGGGWEGSVGIRTKVWLRDSDMPVRDPVNALPVPGNRK